MTPREIIFANLAWDNPPRPGLHFDRDRINDFAGARMGPSKTYEQKRWTEGNLEYYDDPWGNLWYRMVEGSNAGEVHTPVLKDWSALESIELPDFDDPDRYPPVRETYEKFPEKFHLAGMPGWVFATARYMRKMEIYFMDLIEYRAEVDRLHERLCDLFANVIEQYGKAGADGIFFCEDLGVQDRTLMSPAMWRDVFKPHYKRLVGTAHDCGLKVLMHSCGYNWALIDDLIDAGIDCFQFDQPSAYDMPALAEKLRTAKVGLWSPVDIQKVMPTGDRELIEAEARRLVETFRGGLIAKNYPDLHGIGVEEEWDDWAYNAILEAGGVSTKA